MPFMPEEPMPMLTISDLPTPASSQESVALLFTPSSAQASASASTGVLSSQSLGSSSHGVLTTQTLASPRVGQCGAAPADARADQCGAAFADGRLPRGASSSSTRNDTLVPLGMPECVGHRARCHQHEANNSPEDEATIPGERVRRLLVFEKSRRVRRSRKELIKPIIDPSSESEPPALNPSSEEEEWPDPNYVDSDLEDDERVREGPGGDSLTESVTASISPNQKISSRRRFR